MARDFYKLVHDFPVTMTGYWRKYDVSIGDGRVRGMAMFRHYLELIFIYCDSGSRVLEREKNMTNNICQVNVNV